jgi:hypothetical protein
MVVGLAPTMWLGRKSGQKNNSFEEVRRMNKESYEAPAVVELGQFAEETGFFGKYWLETFFQTMWGIG